MANALTALMAAGSVKSGTVSASLKAKSTSDAKILYLAPLMGTTKTGGTTNVALGKFYSARAADFTAASLASLIYKSSTNTIDQTSMLTQMKAHRIPIILIGNYKPSCVNLSTGHVRCTYTRKLGHFMAQSEINGAAVKFHDSRNGATYSSTVNKFPTTDPVSGKPLDPVLPSYFTASNVRRVGAVTNLWLIEGLFSMGPK
jgi:hypothetical protein